MIADKTQHYKMAKKNCHSYQFFSHGYGEFVESTVGRLKSKWGPDALHGSSYMI